MRTLIVVLVFIFFATCIYGEGNWFNESSEHFIIYYKSTPDLFITKVIDSAEYCYDQIADELGFRRFDFWLWDNRAKIYVYDTAAEYQQVTGLPSWSQGAAFPKDKIIHTFPAKQGFFDNILPHEMSHIIFREFVGFNNYAVPLWLDEGVACYHDKQARAQSRKIVQDAMKKEILISPENLANINPLVMTNKSEVNLFYSESLSLIDYLISEFGRDSFVLFCQGLRDKKDLEAALSYAYPFNSLADLEEAWRHYLK